MSENGDTLKAIVRELLDLLQTLSHKAVELEGRIVRLEAYVQALDRTKR